MTEHPEPERIIPGPWLPVAATGLACSLFSFFLLANTDIWWHLAAGREMVRSGAFLRTDPFSVSAFGFPWINIHWLFQLAAYGVYTVAGAYGLVACKALLLGIACFISIATCRSRLATPVVCLVAAAMAFTGRFEILARPTVVSLVLAAGFVWCTERYRASGDVRFLAVLVPLQILWSNMQGLFILGPVIIACYAAGDLAVPLLKRQHLRIIRVTSPAADRTGRRLVLWTALLAAVSLVNPYGWCAYAVPFKLFFRIAPGGSDLFSTQIAENLPVWMSFTLYGLFTRGFGLLLLVSFLLNIRAFVPARFVLYLIFMVLGSMAVRNVPLYVTVCLPVLAFNIEAGFGTLPGRMADRFRRLGPRVLYALLAVVILTGSLDAVRRITRLHPANGLAPFRVPTGAAHFLKGHPVPGTMFHSARHGGYLAWRLYPQKLVFTDGRFILRDPAFLQRFLRVLDRPGDFDRYSRQYAVTHVLLAYRPGSRYAPLAYRLAAHPGWRAVYLDGADVLFVRSDQDGLPAVDPRRDLDRLIRQAQADVDASLASDVDRSIREFAARLAQAADY